MKNVVWTLVGAAALLAAGCGSETAMMTGPGGATGSPAFVAMAPAGGARGVPVGSSLDFRWSTPMGVGMEQFVDLHVGDLSGPVVPMSCAWSGDRTSLVCAPVSPLQPGTHYMVHVGGGLVDATGQVVDMSTYGPGLGGQWAQGGMMGPGHGGTGWGMMGAGWRHSNGAYGMVFTFTTA